MSNRWRNIFGMTDLKKSTKVLAVLHNLNNCRFHTKRCVKNTTFAEQKKSTQMEGINYLLDDKNEKVAVQT